MISMKIAVSMLLASTLVVACYAGKCEVKGNGITCELSKGQVSLADDLKSVQHPLEFTNVTLYGHYVGNYLTKMSKHEKRFWQSKNVKSLKIFTTENESDFSQQSICIFNQSLIKLDFTLSSEAATLIKNLPESSSLDTYYGNFTRIPNLSCLNRLKELNIKSHKITAITSDSLRGLISLEKFDASDNRIARIDPDTFSKATRNLQTVTLWYNNIKKLHKSTFRNQPSLRDLDLSNNKLSSIDGLFQSLPKLENLSLDYNLLTEITTGTFSKGLPNLNYLSLCDNKIKTIQYKAFENLPSLEELHFETNALEAINTGSFIGLPKLNSVSFEYNYIVRIGDNVFDGMPNLIDLEFWGNNLASLNQSSFGSIWNSLQSLDVGDNDFNCTCELKWIVELYQDKAAHTPQLDILMSCWDPQLQNSIDVPTATLHDIHCPTH